MPDLDEPYVVEIRWKMIGPVSQQTIALLTTFPSTVVSSLHDSVQGASLFAAFR